VLGLYQQIEGRIEVDGIDINQINPSDLRRQIGAVNQDQVLFYGTIRENIVMGVPHVEDQVIDRAASLAGVMDFASHHPEGLDLNVGERGRALSGGQRQSVILARALLLDPPLLILDEPTSNMDNSTEAKFMQRLQSIIGDKSLIMVTHKPVLLKMVDQMMVLDSGRVVAYGEKEDVMKQLSSNSIQTAKPTHNKSEGES
jgi:ATP-binding cassette subfamily C protein LapB